MPPAQEPQRHILMVIQHLRPGGAEHQLVHLASGLARRGVRVTLACVGNPDTDTSQLREAGVEVIALGAVRRERRPLVIPRLVRLARKADVVHCTMWDASLWGRIAATLARRPVVVSDHATDRSVQLASSGGRRDRWIALHNRLLDRSTFATVACARSQISVLRGEGVTAERIVYIPNGVPVADLRAEAVPPPSRDALGIPDDARVVIHVAQFRPEKNQSATYDAVAQLRSELGDVHAIFAGIGPGLPPLRERARATGAGWAHFLGMRSDVPALLALSDLAVMPSISDAMPMSLIEAMALGVPVVATDVGDVRSLVEGAGGGICVPAGDQAAFAAGCRRVLGDRGLHARLAAAGRDGALCFDSTTMVDRYEQLFEAAASSRGFRGPLPSQAGNPGR